jgi:two-component system sensor histidine kinase PhoQ
LQASAEREESDESAAAEPRRISEVLEKTRFNRQGAQLFGYVIGQDGRTVWRSASALRIDAPELPSLQQGMTRFGRFATPDASYFAMGIGTYWESGTQSIRYTFYVLESTATSDATLRALRTVLLEWLAVTSLALLVALIMVTRWGLRPLKTLGVRLQRLQSGDTTRVEGHFPEELRQVVADLNSLLDFEEAQRGKYRNSLADLAHSLKTPLAVMQNAIEAMDPEARKVLQDQVQQMNMIVQQQLRRAISRSTSRWGRGCEPLPAIQRVLAALRKAWPDREVEIVLEMRDQKLFPGDEGVWYEIIGNLLDNAFKHGGRRVRISVSGLARGDRSWFCLQVEDDGPGIDPERASMVLQRGARLDSAVPGQGIGLAMVADLVDDLAGTLVVAKGTMGGALFTVEIPD